MHHILHMERINVESSNLVTICYDAKEKNLEVEFHSGKIYRYYCVPKSVYDNLKNPPAPEKSHGKYFDKSIRFTYKYAHIASRLPQNDMERDT